MSPPGRASDPPARHLSLPGGPVAVTDEGEGPPVLAIHGMPGSRFDFRYLAPTIRHARIIRVDLPGFSGSAAGRVRPRVGALVDVLTGVLDALAIGRVSLLAHSFGAGIAARLADRLGRRARGLAVLAPAGLRPHNLLRHQRTVRAIGAAARTPGLGWAVGHALIPAYRAAGFRRATAAEARQTFAVVGGWDWGETRQATARLAAAGLPALVAFADDDPIVERDHMVDWAAQLGVPPLRFATGGHGVQKTRATEIGAALDAWLGQLPAP